jgi:hypothetical protein
MHFILQLTSLRRYLHHRSDGARRDTPLHPDIINTSICLQNVIIRHVLGSYWSGLFLKFRPQPRRNENSSQTACWPQCQSSWSRTPRPAIVQFLINAVWSKKVWTEMFKKLSLGFTTMCDMKDYWKSRNVSVGAADRRTFLPLGASTQGELWPPEQSASILLYSSSILPILSLSFCEDHHVDPPSISTWVFLSSLLYIFYF